MEVMDTINEYEHLYSVFSSYKIEELLSLCEKHQLPIYGNRELIIDRLAYYFSEGRRKHSFHYKIKECCDKLILKFNNYYIQI